MKELIQILEGQRRLDGELHLDAHKANLLLNWLKNVDRLMIGQDVRIQELQKMIELTLDSYLLKGSPNG